MTNIGLGQSIYGSFTTSDSKDSAGQYYDEYDLTGIDDFRQLTIKVDAAPYSSIVQSVWLTNATTGSLIDYNYVGSSSYTGPELSRATRSSLNYKIRVYGTNQLGDYTLSVLDGGKASSIVSSVPDFYSNSVSKVETVGTSGIYFPLASGSTQLTDIALAPNGQLYGVDYGNSLRLINPGASKDSQIDPATFILRNAQGVALTGYINALEFANNALYAIDTGNSAGDKLYKIDVTTKVATLVGNLPNGFVSTGDLVYDSANSRFLATSVDSSTSDALWRIPINNPSTATKVGSIGFTGVGGIDFVNGQLTGFTSNGPSYNTTKSQINIDVNTGQGSIGQQISGYENYISGASTIVYPGQVLLSDVKQDPGKYMGSIRDYDGNNLGSSSSWKLLGDVDIQGDGDLESILVNPAIGRFASVGAVNGAVDFSKYGLNGDTRVVGIYIDPTLKNQPQNIGGPFDSQRRFQNDLRYDNLKLLAAGDYNKDGFQDMYFKLGDGSAVLRALMFKDGNIQYANYQSKTDLTNFMTTNNVSSSIWSSWI
jgi:hypothetical protein